MRVILELVPATVGSPLCEGCVFHNPIDRSCDVPKGFPACWTSGNDTESGQDFIYTIALQKGDTEK